MVVVMQSHKRLTQLHSPFAAEREEIAAKTRAIQFLSENACRQQAI